MNIRRHAFIRIGPAIATLALLSMMARTAQGQYVYIPDPGMRDWLNTYVPGVVDGNGNMDTTYAGIAAFDYADLMLDPFTGPFDLTGLKYLDGLQTLNLFLTPDVTSLPAFPWALQQLQVDAWGQATLPPFPSSLNSLELSAREELTVIPDFPTALQSLNIDYLLSVPVLPPLPPGLTFLQIRDALNLGSLPDLPSTLTTLLLYDLPIATLPELPVGLETIELRHLDQLATLPDWPDPLTTLNLLVLPEVTFVPELPQGLQQFACDSPGVGTIMPSLPSGLHILEFSGMPAITSWPVFPPALADLGVGSIPLTYWPTIPTTLNSFSVHNMAGMGTLPTLPPGLHYLFAWDMPDLVLLPPLPEGLGELDIERNPLLSMIPPLPQSLSSLTLIDCDNVSCLPTIPISVEFLSVYSNTIDCLPNELSEWCYPDITFDPSNICTEPCSDSGPLVGGHVFHDLNGNGVQDGGDHPLANATVSIEPGSRLAGTNTNGSYWSSLPFGTWSLSATALCSFDQSSSPQEHTALLDDPTDQDTTLHFAIMLEPGHNDLSASITSTDPRPGFTNVIWLSIVNSGTEPLSSELAFTFDPEQQWTDGSIAPQSLSGNVATWNVPELLPSETWNVTVTLSTPSSVPLGTILTSTMAVVPSLPDETPVDDNAALSQEVVGSFDPNDKRVTPAMLTMSDVAAGEKLSYVIRFQNTGTAPAERVRISDLLDDRLQWNSFRLVASSHPCSWTLENGLLTFDFFPILLPDSTSDEPGSHGFVRFEILPSTSVLAGDLVPNSASIFFDYNAAIVTNTAVVGIEVQQEVASSRSVASLLPYPNPASDRFSFGPSLQSGRIQRVELFAPDGRLIMMRTAPFPEEFIRVGDLAPGLFAVRMVDDQGIHTFSLIIDRK